MVPEERRGNDTEASHLSRREYLLATGAVTGGIVTAASGSASAAADVAIDVTSLTVNHNWKTVSLTNSYSDPVVVAPTLSHDGTNPASPRVRNVESERFDIAVDEWIYLDGLHLNESIGCFVADAGEHDPSDGPAFETGHVETNHRWSSASFSSSFSEDPIVFTNAQTHNGRDSIVTRNRGVDASGMDVRLQEEQNEGAHYPETVAYLAMSPGAGTIDGRACEADVAGSVDHTWQTISFSDSYRQPIFLADMQSYRGTNTATIRYRNLTGSDVEVKVQEEQSLDQETDHIPERVGYLVFEGEPEHEGYGLGGFGEGGYGQ